MLNNRNLITVVGSSNTDLATVCPHLPRHGETVLGSPLHQSHGGKGANQAVAAKRAIQYTFNVAFIGAHGDDDFGRSAKNHLQQEGIDVSHFYNKPEATSGVALIMIGGNDRENMIAVTQSANDALNSEDILSAKVLLQKSAVVLCQLEIPLETVMATAKSAAENSAEFILNPAPARALPPELYSLVSVLTPNEREALSLTNTDDIHQAARQLQDWGCQQLAITLGAEGVLICNQNGNKRIAAPKVSAVDTVGAGDCFNGWLAAGLAEGLSLEEAATHAVRAAAVSVTRQGAQESMPLREEIGLK